MYQGNTLCRLFNSPKNPYPNRYEFLGDTAFCVRLRHRIKGIYRVIIDGDITLKPEFINTHLMKRFNV